MGKRYDVPDLEARGLAVRVNDRGDKTFVLIARFAGRRNRSRRTIGRYPAMSLEQARDEARQWRQQLKEGRDPRVEQERRRQAALRRQARTFASVCEEYFADIKRRNLRCASEVKLIYGLKVPC